MINHKIEIYNPRFVGQRFNDHALPIEMMDDLVAIEDLTIALAKHIYLEENPERKRVPRGFTNGISIKLESIEEGSTILKIALFVISTNLFPPENSKYFTKASERLVSAVQSANEEKDFTELLPENYLNYFNRIGKSLYDSEHIEFTPNGETKSILDKTIRKRLILGSSKAKEYNDEIDIRGLIVEMDKAKNTFQIQLINGSKITGNLNENCIQDIQLAFNDFENGQIVSLRGNGKFSRADKLMSIEMVDEITLLDQLDVPARLESISMFKDGWLNEDSKQLDKDLLQWLASKFEENFNPDLPLPTLFPTPEGNIVAEWSNSKFEVSTEFILASKKANVEVLNLNDNSDFEKELDIEEEDDWTSLNNTLAKYLS